MDADELLKQIGAKIRTLRTEKDYTQGNMADMLNIATSSLAQIESGKANISFKKLGKIAKFFDLTLLEMLNLAGVSYYNFKTKKNSITGVNINNNTIKPDKNNKQDKRLAKMEEKIDNLAQMVEDLKQK